MIDFNATHDLAGYIHFCNSDGDSLKQYKMSDLEKYIIDNRLNIKKVSANGCISSDPNIIEEEIETPLADYVDLKWFDVTKDFYMDMNKEEFKSGNSIYPYAKQGIYSIQPATKSK